VLHEQQLQTRAGLAWPLQSFAEIQPAFSTMDTIILLNMIFFVVDSLRLRK
jgi:hypothetical protein